MQHRSHTAPTREILATRFAEAIAAVLKGATFDRPAALAVSGGNTPKLFFEKLSREDIPWEHVTVTLVDERWVPEASDRSNAALVKRHLLQNRAAVATFVPLFTGDDRPEDGVDAVTHSLQPWLSGGFDVVVLGMGPDGHTASLFPDAARLGEGIDPARAPAITAIHAPSAGEPRITLNLAAILNARHIYLHVEGEQKLEVLEAALMEGPVHELPVRAVLHQKTTPITIYRYP